MPVPLTEERACPGSPGGPDGSVGSLMERAASLPAMLAPDLASNPEGGQRSLPYRTGRWLADHREEIVAFVSDPVNLTMLVVLLVAVCVALVLALKSGLNVLRATWAALHAEPGEVTLGVRRELLIDRLAGPSVKLAFGDARKGGIIFVGPTGQGKTTVLLLVLLQALRWGHTVIVLEADGNLGLRLLKYARAMGLGKRCFHFDPSVPDAWRWNPLSGEPERAVRRAVNTVLSVSQNHPFFGGLNENVMRQMTRLTISYAAHAGSEPTLELLLRLLTDNRFLDEILDFGPGDTEAPEIRAAFVTGDLKVWLEQEYLSWSPRVRGEYLLGLRNFLRSLLSDERLVEMLCPRAGEPTIDVRGALNSGGLLVFRCASNEVGEVESQTILSWVQQTIQQETLGRSTPMRPVWSTIDEAHVVLGSHNTATAQSYSRWFVQSRKFGVVPLLGYQSFFQLPDSLRKVIAGSARNKLIFGGLHGDDARHAQELLGHTIRRKTETRRTSTGGLLTPKSTTQEVTTSIEEPYYPLTRVETLPVGYCFFKGVRGKRQPPPAMVKLGKLPSVRRLRVTAPGAQRRRRSRKGGAS